jgi:hypothetical protein
MEIHSGSDRPWQCPHLGDGCPGTVFCAIDRAQGWKSRSGWPLCNPESPKLHRSAPGESRQVNARNLDVAVYFDPDWNASRLAKRGAILVSALRAIRRVSI